MIGLRQVLFVVLPLAGAVCWAARNAADDYPYIPFDHAAIQYPASAGNNAIAALQAKLDRGQARLDFDARWGYLPSLMKRLDVNVDSQMLVFSKTSFQAPRISAKKPRAIYFNDSVSIGFVQDGPVFELTAHDARQGIVFYTLSRDKTARPRFEKRSMECLSCHLFPGTLNVPGLMITSVIPDPNGALRFVAAATMVDSRTPLDQRWGGWYVTGNSGALKHRGNSFAPDPDRPSEFELTGNQNLATLDARFDTAPYLGKGSDIVALMTMEHQTRMTDLLTRVGWETRIAQQEGAMARFEARLDFLTDEVVSCMLFGGEAKIDSPIQGSSAFATTFPARGPRDRQGRSLRDFDLRTRLFRYPLSYLIYSPAFDALPDAARDRIWRRLFDSLRGPDAGAKSPWLTAADRTAIVEILRDTKRELPAYWRAGV